MDDRPEQRYLVHIRLGGTVPVRDRLAKDVPGIKTILEQISSGVCQLAYSSQDGGSFGFLVRTHLHATKIIRKLESPGDSSFFPDPNKPIKSSPLSNDDQLLVLEIGDDFSSRGMGRAGTWLQRNRVEDF